MKSLISRRDFLGSTTRAGAVWGLSPRGTFSRPLERGPARDVWLDQPGIEAEIRRRAEQYRSQRRLVVDYYRIRRRLAYPLPVVSLSIPTLPVPTLPDYPWSIWMLWQLEERVNALGWAAEWFKSEEVSQTASRDLDALSIWPKYCQLNQPDLASAHAARLFWTALTKWNWLSQALRKKMLTACARHVEEVLPLADAYYGPLPAENDRMAPPVPTAKLHNIALIGTVGAALAAHALAHPAASALNQRVRAIFGTILDLRAEGFSEGVAYDGYVLDFVADWLEGAPVELRKEILEHARLSDFLDESYMLAAPGALGQLAELSDVEPQQMPFHYSAQAKLARLRPDPVRNWFLRRWRLDWIRSNALGALHPIANRLQGSPPEAGAMNAHYAVVLRTGWEKEDLAMAMSCSNSPMDHVQNDSGTLVIGTRQRWLVSDPGYEQYMQDSERDFTLGPAAHNYPLINEAAQDKKQSRLLRLARVAPDVLHAKLELAGCYPREAGIRSVVRSVWLVGAAGVIVSDEILADSVRTVAYHWHGHPEAAWWSENGWMLLHLPDVDLWFTSPQARLSQANIQRLPGSRGQLTLVAPIEPATSVIWWVFAISPQAPLLESLEEGKGVQFLGKRFPL